MATEPFIGRWKVVEYIPSCGESDDLPALKSCEFELTESGDVNWYPADPASSLAKNLPLFKCRTFEVLREREGLSVVINLRFGAYRGHILEFRLESTSHTSPRDGMFLAYSGWCTLVCQPVTESSKPSTSSSPPSSPTTATPTTSEKKAAPQFPFHALAALEEGFFSDLELVSDSGRSYRVHRSILQSATSAPFLNPEEILNRLPDRVLRVLLHYLYGQCLPQSITVDTLNACREAVGRVDGFDKFSEMSDLYTRNSALCQKIVNLVNELHGTVNAVIIEFGGRPVHLKDPKYKPSSAYRGGDALINNPNRLSQALKQSLRNIAMGVVKFVQLFALYARSESRLTRTEQHEIMLYAKKCLPIFLGQVNRLLNALKNCTASMTLSVRQEIASYFVPELEAFVDLVNELGFEMKGVLESVIAKENADIETSRRTDFADAEKGRSGATDPNASEQQSAGMGRPAAWNRPEFGWTGKSLNHTLKTKDILNMNKFHRHLTLLFSYLVQEKETFSELGPAGKVRTVSWQMEQLVDELPLYLLRLNEFSSLIDERMDFGTFKFCFVFMATFIENVLTKFCAHRDTLRPFLDRACSLIQSDSFTAGLVDLGLVENPSDDDEAGAASATIGRGEHGHLFKMPEELNLCGKLHVPASPESNDLARNVSKILEAMPNPDMEVVVSNAMMMSAPQREGSGDDEDGDESGRTEEVIKCHRVILAARCPYFRRALLSGMREAIERRVEVHDTTPALFKSFLRFVYSGKLGESDMDNSDSLSELLLLADRYEMDSLKELCEGELVGRVDSDSALTLLSIADHFNASKLKASCVEFIMQNEELLHTKTFQELSEGLQNELEELASWDQRAVGVGGDRPPPPGMWELSDMTARMRLRTDFDADGEEIETIPLTHDSNQLDTCVNQLRDVLGPLISQEQLVRVALAADYDVNRAINHFFNSES